MEEPLHGSVAYFIEEDVLYANGSCETGYYFLGAELETMQIDCRGSFWSDNMPDCMGKCTLGVH